MAASSSSGDVFLSFSGEDVRKKFLSHLRMALDRRSIISFNDHGIERSRQIGPELLSAIRKARISVVIFSKKFAASTWCLDELVEIHNYCDMVIPVFYYVDPSNVRKQTGQFGKVFEETCQGKQKDHIQKWKQALTDVANRAGEHPCNWPSEVDMVENIANDVSNKLITPSNGFCDFVGIEAHIKAMYPLLSLECEEPSMIGIWGQSGIGKSTLGRALYGHLCPKFLFCNFTVYKCTDQDASSVKFSWESNFLSEILGQKYLKIENSGVVKKILKDRKVLIVLDDVVNPQFLKTLVGNIGWFGYGSRIIVITQDMHILKAHNINLLYEVKIPAQDIALTMLCRFAFAQDSPPDDFKELAVEVAKVVGNLPLGLLILSWSLKGRTKEEWMELLLGLQNGLKGDIISPIIDILKVSYDRLDEKEQDLFLWIAFLFNDRSAKCINDFLGDVNTMLKRLAEKSLIRIAANGKIVEMHKLLEKLGREIVRAESKYNPRKRRKRFLTDAEEIRDVFTHQTGMEYVLGIFFGASPIDEISFDGMSRLRFLQIHSDYNCPQRYLGYLPPKLQLLVWDNCPLKCLPSNFKAEFLVELKMEYSKLEKLWEGTQQLGSLKTIIMSESEHLNEIPDLSKAINLERVDFSNCRKLESFPNPLNWGSLEYLNLFGCSRLTDFPEIKMQSLPHGTEIEVKDCLWNKNLPGLDYLDCFRKCYPLKFLPEHLVRLTVKGNTLEKLWGGIQSLGSLQKMDMSESENLKEIPDLSTATNLVELDLSHCKSLVKLPINVNLSSLKTLNLKGCSSLTSFPQISRSIENLNLDDTNIEEVPCCVKMFWKLTRLSMSDCDKLKKISPNIFRMTDCGGVITALGEASVVATSEDPSDNICKGNKVEKTHDENNRWYFNFQNCLKLDRDARELIIQSSLKWTMVLPGGEVPTYFKHQAYGNSLTVTLPQSSLSHHFLRFNVCVVVKPRSNRYTCLSLHFRFNGKYYMHIVTLGSLGMCKTDHLVLCSFKLKPKGLSSKLDSNDVEFKFSGLRRIKECGVRLLHVFPSPEDRFGRSYETAYNQLSGEKCYIVETERRKKQKLMTSGKSKGYFSGQILTETRESSSVSFYPCPEGEALCIDSMITEQQDAQLPIARLDPYPDLDESGS